MFLRLTFTASLSLLTATIPQIANAKCLDVSKHEPGTLEGKLLFIVFPGRPNYEDVKSGDEPEGTYILKLANQICIEGDEFADATKLFDTVHLVPPKGLRKDLRPLVGRTVKVTLYDQYGSHTGHHHAPLVAWVSKIALAKQ